MSLAGSSRKEVGLLRRLRAVGAVVALLALAGCSSGGAPGSDSPRTAGETEPVAPTRPPGSCHTRGSAPYSLPDPACTPGRVNAAVQQGNIGQTICVDGWTSTVRPPESYTEPLKYQQMAAYGFSGSASGYEEDHLIPLALGGSPTSAQNLWPQPGASPNPKDDVEQAANQAVCRGQMTLAAAQQAIAADWVALGRRLGVIGPATTPANSPAPGCTVTVSYNAQYHDYDVYVHSDQPDQAVKVSATGGSTAAWHTDGSGYADVYLHLIGGPAGQRVTASVGGATCSTTLG